LDFGFWIAGKVNGAVIHRDAQDGQDRGGEAAPSPDLILFILCIPVNAAGSLCRRNPKSKIQIERGGGVQTVLIYDITSDRVRGKVADACLDYGLERIQYSAFFGEISGNHLEELLQRIRRLLGKEEDEATIEVFPICEKDLRLRRTLTACRLRPPRRPGRPARAEKGEEE
jgi:CRISPR-associated protein Cas2